MSFHHLWAQCAIIASIGKMSESKSIRRKWPLLLLHELLDDAKSCMVIVAIQHASGLSTPCSRRPHSLGFKTHACYAAGSLGDQTDNNPSFVPV